MLPLDLTAIRHHLHHYPELSGNETDTADYVANILNQLGPDELIRGIGGTGLAAVFKGRKKGSRILFRAELDALPIVEAEGRTHRSSRTGVAHLCGHDGHMAILLGLAERLSYAPPEHGEVVLLFQPSEETGEGAKKVIMNPVFQRIRPDAAIALHNLPTYPENMILLRAGPFACSSRGLIFRLKGISSHAAHPEQGKSPSLAAARIIEAAEHFHLDDPYTGFVLATVIHARIGDVAFGTTPGDAVVMVTLRAEKDEDMELLVLRLTEKVRKIADAAGLGLEIAQTEVFPSTVNDEHLTGLVRSTAREAGSQILELEEPFRWSEDFGHFGRICPSVLFGIGAGLGHPPLHHPEFDFNDVLLDHSVGLMKTLSEKLTHDSAALRES